MITITAMSVLAIILILTNNNVLNWMDTNLTNPFKLMGSTMWAVPGHYTILTEDTAFGTAEPLNPMPQALLRERIALNEQMHKDAHVARITTMHQDMDLNDMLANTIFMSDDTITSDWHVDMPELDTIMGINLMVINPKHATA